MKTLTINNDTYEIVDEKARNSIAEVSEKFENGGSGIHIGTEAPTDPNVNAWIDTDEEAPGGGGVSSWSDLGSKWEVGTVLAETSPAFVEDMGAFVLFDPVSVTVGEQYTVNWNGTEYNCTCVELDSGTGIKAPILGNAGALGMGDDTGEPFLFAISPPDMVEEAGYGAGVYAFDGSTELTISITGMVETVTPIPQKYLPKPVFLYTDGTYLYKTPDTTDANNLLIKSELASLIESGRTIYVCHNSDDTIGYFTPVDALIRSDGGTISVINTTGSITRAVFAAPNTRNI